MAPSACSACSEDVIVGLTAADVLSGCSPCKACGEMVPPSSVAAAAALVREGLDLSPGDEGVTRARRPHAEPRPHGGRALRAHGSTMSCIINFAFPSICTKLREVYHAYSTAQMTVTTSSRHMQTLRISKRVRASPPATSLAEASACRPAAMGLARYLSKSNGELRHPGRARSTSEYSSPGAFGIGVAVRSSRAAAGTWATALAVAVAQAVRLVDDEEVDADGRRGEERVAVVMQRLVRHDEDGVLEGLPELRRRWHRGQRAELARGAYARHVGTRHVDVQRGAGVRAEPVHELGAPILHLVGWHHDQDARDETVRDQSLDGGDGLQRLAESGIVGEDGAAAPEVSDDPSHAHALVRVYLAVEIGAHEGAQHHAVGAHEQPPAQLPATRSRGDDRRGIPSSGGFLPPAADDISGRARLLQRRRAARRAPRQPAHRAAADGRQHACAAAASSRRRRRHSGGVLHAPGRGGRRRERGPRRVPGDRPVPR